MPEPPNASSHPDAAVTARYLDGQLPADERALVDAHLAECSTCREEVVAIFRLPPITPHRPGFLATWSGQVVALAAAATLLLLVWPTSSRGPAYTTRTSSPSTSPTPRGLAPVGAVSSLDSLRWSAVPGARRYQVTLYGGDARALGRMTAIDTVVAIPDSIHLLPGPAYYWQVKAETELGRWVQSELVEFRLRTGTARPGTGQG